jgi:hypothetical protein
MKEVDTITDQSHITQLKLEADYIERQIYLRKAAPEDYERLRKIIKLLRKLTK